MTEKRIAVPKGVNAPDIFGSYDENVKLLEEAFDVRISYCDGEDGNCSAFLLIRGESENADSAVCALTFMLRMISDGRTLDRNAAEYAIRLAEESPNAADSEEGNLSSVLCLTGKGKPVKPKTVAQRQYVEAIRENPIVLCTGPAGTGKTFLAVAMAVDALRKKLADRIVLTRPAVEAGERLGFLPGDLQSKVDPYLRPLYDALAELLGMENFQKYLERGTIEIAPLAYMRGRTLDDSFIILDEAQNTTVEQMKMFLTRLGYRSKAVVTGDLSQIDLPLGKNSGLAVAKEILADIDGIGIFSFTDRDVVRHPLVRRIIGAYDQYENARKKNLRKEIETSKDETI